MLEVREPSGTVNDQATTNPRNIKPKSGRKNTPGEKIKGKQKGLSIECLFTKEGVSPFDAIEWDKRKTSISDDKGNAIFSRTDVEVPKAWSQLAANVVSSKYFYGSEDSEYHEKSVRELVHRVVRTIADWGLKDGYFETPEDSERFYGELSHLCLNQYGSFNSPVWFNAGLYHVQGISANSRCNYHWDVDEDKAAMTTNSYEHPQVSACFIQSVDDTMEDIMRLATSEAMIFKYGSGTGTDLSTLRSSREKLSGGGTPSGPLSFMKVFDQVAAVIKSGGKTRRAAKMQSIRIDHPDVIDFITCKTKEEKKAWALIDQGYDGSFGGEAYDSVMFQNANLSIRVTDEFMRAVENDGEWETKAVTTGETIDTHKARELMRMIAEGAHVCGDPGVQYDTTINKYHTCKESGRINASNPCSEYMFVDNSACNLASLNLTKFVNAERRIDLPKLKHAVRLYVIAQDILVDNASYPSVEMTSNSHNFRPLGLGYANLGALLMSMGLPYDSDEGRAWAGAVTAVMSAYAYSTSSEIAETMGTFEGFAKNRDGMQDVMTMHNENVGRINSSICPPDLMTEATKAWEQVLVQGEKNGFRNAQVTLLAPTGTIGFMMDCDTTGVEPDIALVKYKQLAGGGLMKIVNRSVRRALETLGYSEDQIDVIVKHIHERETIEGAPGLKDEHLEVFDCAFKPKDGVRSISFQAHLKMMAAVQPFLSGAISKTINMQSETTESEIVQAYIDGWKLGLKSVAIYRDGSKRTQPINLTKTGDQQDGKNVVPENTSKPFRRRMPHTRQSITHKFEIAGHEGYLTVGIYEDGTPGELFITMAKEGSTVGGTMDAFGTAISLCLQYGVPVKELIKKFAHSRFEPSGFSSNPDIPMAKSIVDYIFRWLELTFPEGDGALPAAQVSPTNGSQNGREREKEKEAPVATQTAGINPPAQGERVDEQFQHFSDDAPACDVCGAITVRNGSCYRCWNCGNSMGCS